MKSMHAGAALCFFLAMACYFASWVPGALGLGFVGILFEIAAWHFFAIDVSRKRKP
jgi:hypothetical protein